MSDYATTPRLGLKKPTEDADDDLWGGHLNSNFDVLDTAPPAAHTHPIADVTGLQPALDATLPLAGGTMTGSLILAHDPAAALEAATRDYVDNLAGGATGSGTWNWITAAQPGAVASGNVGTDTDNPAVATALHISGEAVNRKDYSAFLRALHVGDAIALWDTTDSSRWGRWDITANAIDHGVWFEIPIAPQTGQGGEPNNNTDVDVVLMVGGAATANDARYDARYVNVSGDAMTGNLTVSRYEIIDGGASGPAQLLLDAPAGQQRLIAGRTGTSTRWTMLLGGVEAETGSNAGSNFVLSRFDDAGSYVADTLRINRATGVADFIVPPTVVGVPLAPLASPVFTGNPQAPTPVPGDNDTSIATTAFVINAVSGSVAGVASFNTRTGAVTLSGADITGAGGAPLASPAFTGNPTAPTPPVGDADTSVSTTAFVAAAVAPLTNNAGRNLVMNGTFAVAQRGTGPFSTVGGYTLDRWQLVFNGDTDTVTSQPFTDAARAQVGDEAANVYLFNQCVGAAGAGNYSIVQQPIEGVRRLAGKTVTVSFWAVTGAGTSKLGVGMAQDFGSGGSPSAAGNLTGQAVTLNTVWARYSMAFNVPSASGKTFGTNGNDRTTLQFWFSAGATYATASGTVGTQTANIGIWGVQLEIGSVATPLDYGGTPQQQLAACQRFYQTGFAQQSIGSNSWQASWTNTHWALFPVQMRATPTMTTYAIVQTNCTGTAIGAVGVGLGWSHAYSITAATGGVASQCSWTASADL